MITNEHEQLIQDVLAGEASPAQAAELERVVTSDPDARERYEEMREVFRTLAETPAVNPPAGLHADIMRSVTAESPPRLATRRRSSLVPMLGAFLAGAAAASLVVISVLRGTGDRTFGSAGDASGTMAPRTNATDGASSSNTLTTPSGRIALSCVRTGGEILLTIDSRATQPVAIEVQYAREVELTGLRWTHEPSGEVRASAGNVALAGTVAGVTTLTLVARHDADVTIRVNTIHTREPTGVTFHMAAHPGAD